MNAARPSDHRTHQPLPGAFVRNVLRRPHPADDPTSTPCLTRSPSSRDSIITHFGVVDEQLLLRLLDEVAERGAGVFRAHDQPLAGNLERLPRPIRFEQLERLQHVRTLPRDDAKTAAAGSVDQREIESKQIQASAVHHQEFAVVAHELVAGSRHRGARFEEPLFELAEVLFSALVGMRNQRRTFTPRLTAAWAPDLAIEPEDQDVDFLGRSNAGQISAKPSRGWTMSFMNS